MKISIDFFNEYLLKVRKDKHPSLRLGQHYYNVLYTMDESLAMEVVATDYDPFYSDLRIKLFLNWLVEKIDFDKK